MYAIWLLITSFCFMTSCSKMEEETIALSQNELKDHITITIDATCFDPNGVNPITPCPAIYRPVCACKTFTFSNGCEAEAWGFSNYTEGACLEPVCYSAEAKKLFQNTPCPAEKNKVVFGCNGITYPSVCEARRDGIMLNTKGSCEYGTNINLDSLKEKGCFDPDNIELLAVCPQVIAPVCACGVIQFGNGCQAEAAGFRNYEEGGCVENRCQSNTVKKFFSNFRFNCNAFEPKVCGCNGVDYDSWCHALVSGVIAWTPGPCNNPDEIIEDLVTIQN
jgi:hypothetical protein